MHKSKNTAVQCKIEGALPERYTDKGKTALTFIFPVRNRDFPPQNVLIPTYVLTQRPDGFEARRFLLSSVRQPPAAEKKLAT